MGNSMGDFAKEMAKSAIHDKLYGKDSGLEACPDCGSQVSRSSYRCPHCGCNLTYVRDRRRRVAEFGRQAVVSAAVVVGFFLFMIVVYLGEMFS